MALRPRDTLPVAIWPRLLASRYVTRHDTWLWLEANRTGAKRPSRITPHYSKNQWARHGSRSVRRSNYKAHIYYYCTSRYFFIFARRRSCRKSIKWSLYWTRTDARWIFRFGIVIADVLWALKTINVRTCTRRCNDASARTVISTVKRE